MSYYKEICSMADSFTKIVESQLSDEEKKSLGDKALELIGDYPLYSATSNISYTEAISVALIIFGDIEKAYDDKKKWEQE